MNSRKMIIAAAIAAILAANASAQSRQPSERLLRTVVRRIIIATIKPEAKPRKVLIVEGPVKKEWLPSIRNVEFEIIPRDSDKDKLRDSYYFTEVEIKPYGYDIGFGHGDPSCSHSGDTWTFRYVGRKIKLQQTGGFRGSCNSIADFRKSRFI